MQKYRKVSLPGSPALLPIKFMELINKLKTDPNQTDILTEAYFDRLDNLKSSIQGVGNISSVDPKINNELIQLYARLSAYNTVFEKHDDSTLKSIWPKMADYLSKKANPVYSIRHVNSAEEKKLLNQIHLRVTDEGSISENNRPKVEQSKSSFLSHIKGFSPLTLLLNGLYKPNIMTIEANKDDFLRKHGDSLELGLFGKPVTAIYAERNDSGTIQHIYTHADVDYTDAREFKDIYYIMIKQQLQLAQYDYDLKYIKEVLNKIPTQAETFLTKSEIDSAKKLTLNQLKTDPKALELAHSIFAKMLVHHLYEPYNVFTKWPEMAQYTSKGVADLFYINRAKDFLIGRANGTNTRDITKLRGIFNSNVQLSLKHSADLGKGGYKTVIVDSKVNLSSDVGGGRDFDIPPMVVRDSVLSTSGLQANIAVHLDDVSIQDCAFTGRLDNLSGLNPASIKLYFPNYKDGYLWLNGEDFFDNITNLDNSYISFINSLKGPFWFDTRVSLFKQVVDWSRNNLQQISYNGLMSLLALSLMDEYATLPSVSDFRTQLITELTKNHRGSEGVRLFTDTMMIIRNNNDESFDQNQVISSLLNHFLSGRVSVENSEAINALLFEIRRHGHAYDTATKELASQLSKEYTKLPEIDEFVKYLDDILSLDAKDYQMFVTTAPNLVPVDPLDIMNTGEMKAAPLANKRIVLALDKDAMDKLLLRNYNERTIDTRGIAFTIDGDGPANYLGMIPLVMDSYPLVRPGYSEYKSRSVINDIINGYGLPKAENDNFIDAVYSKASIVKYITPEDDKRLAKTLNKYVIQKDLLTINRNLQITPEHQQSILEKYHKLTNGNSRREAQVLLGMAAIFAELSSKTFFGTDKATSFPLRLMSLAYFNAALSRDSQLNINTDYIRNALTGVRPDGELFARTCTALVAAEMEKAMRLNFPEIYRKVIPLAWQ